MLQMAQKRRKTTARKKKNNNSVDFAIVLFFGTYALLGCIMQVGAYGFA